MVLLDMGLEDSDITIVTMALAAGDELDATPVIMIDPEQPMNALGLRRRIDEAIRVTRRVYLAAVCATAWPHSGTASRRVKPGDGGPV